MMVLDSMVSQRNQCIHINMMIIIKGIEYMAGVPLGEKLGLPFLNQQTLAKD